MVNIGKLVKIFGNSSCMSNMIIQRCGMFSSRT